MKLEYYKDTKQYRSKDTLIEDIRVKENRKGKIKIVMGPNVYTIGAKEFYRNKDLDELELSAFLKKRQPQPGQSRKFFQWYNEERRKEIARKKSMPKHNSMNLTMYTEDVWFKSYKDQDINNEEHYMNFIEKTTPSSIVDVTLDNLRKNGYNVAALDFVVLDEEYFIWLKNKKCENTTEKRLEYINSISIENIERLWKKNKFNIQYSHGVIPFTMFSDKQKDGNKELPKEVVAEIKKSISQSINAPEKDVYVSTIAYKGDYAINYMEELIQNCKLSLSNNKLIPIPSIPLKDTISFINKDMTTVMNRFIFVAVKNEHSYKYTYKENYYDKSLLGYLEGNKIVKATWVKMLRQNPEYGDVEAPNMLIYPDEILDYIEDVNGVVQETNKKMIKWYI